MDAREPDPGQAGTPEADTELAPEDAADQAVQDQADERQWVDTCLTAISTALAADLSAWPDMQSVMESLISAAACRAKRALRSDLGRGRV
jgi:hypothetical protein